MLPKRKFQHDSIRAILENPFYAGLLARYLRPEFDLTDDVEHPENIPNPKIEGNSREILELHPGRQQALISVETWQAVKNLREQKANSPANTTSQARIYPLTGVGRCWECFESTGQEYSLRGSTDGRGTYRYRCAYDHAHSLKRTPKRQVNSGLNAIPAAFDFALLDRHSTLRADKIEPQVDRLLAQLIIPPDWDDLVTAYYLTDEGMSHFERETFNLRQALKRFQYLFQAGQISQAEFEKQARFINTRLNEFRPSTQPGAAEILPLVQDFPAVWMQMTNGEKRALLGVTFAGLYFDRQGQLRRAVAHSPFDELLDLPEDGLLL